MAASGSQSLARSAGVSAASHAGGRDRLASGWVAAGTALVTLVVTLYRIGVPSFTRDEGATLLAVHRSFPQLIRMLGNVDVVHTEYYALIWMVSRLAGSGELAARAPSAVAMAVSAGVVSLLGQRLVSGRAGLAAGLLFAAFPSVSFYAEDAREYALVTALATIASYFLVRALQAATPPQPPGPSPRDEGTGPQATGGFQGGRSPGLAEPGSCSSIRLPAGSYMNDWRPVPTGTGSVTRRPRPRSSATAPSRSVTASAKCWPRSGGTSAWMRCICWLPASSQAPSKLKSGRSVRSVRPRTST